MEQAARQIISLPRERSSRVLGTDELNICEFPLSSTGRAADKGKNTLVFEDQIFDEGTKQPVQRKLIVSASEAFGLPTPADSDVLLVLMHLTNLQNSFKDRTVRFTRYELAKCLGWDHGGKSYRRIDEALNRWVNITLNYNRAWWDRDERRWESKSFHILESVNLRGRGNSRDDGTSSFSWNQVIFASFQANNVKPLDLDTYFLLKLPTAKRAYRFLDKRFYRSKMLEFDLRVFACEHIGLSRNCDIGQLKRKLQPTINELEQIGFLKPMTPAERYTKRLGNDWVIKLIREGEAVEAAPVPEIKSTHPLLEELTRRGVHAGTAKELVEQFAEEFIRAKIALVEWLVSQGGERAPKNQAGYLTAAIRNDYQPPSDYKVIRTTKEKVTKRQAPPSAAAEELSDQRRADAARSFFQSLPPEEQARIEHLAIENGNRFRVQMYLRHKESGGKLLAVVRDDLVRSYLESTGAIGTATGTREISGTERP